MLLQVLTQLNAKLHRESWGLLRGENRFYSWQVDSEETYAPILAKLIINSQHN